MLCLANEIYFQVSNKGRTHMMSIKIVQFSRPPIPLVQQRPKFFHLLHLGHPISNKLPS